MSRATNAPASRRRRKAVLRQARGFRGSRSKLYRQAAGATDRAMALATIHRKLKKRDYRGLWIVRVSAACRAAGISYSRFMQGLTKAGVALNRKMLSEIAVNDPAGFQAILQCAKSALA